MAICRRDVPGQWDKLETEGWDAWSGRIDKMLEKLDKRPKKGCLGAVIGFPVADGKVLYHVVKEKPLELAFIPYGDKYSISEAHIRGLRLQDVQRMVDFDRMWDKGSGK